MAVSILNRENFLFFTKLFESEPATITGRMLTLQAASFRIGQHQVPLINIS